MDKLTSIRCPNTRPHSNKYELCNHLLGAIKQNRIFVYCEICHRFFEVIIKENDNVEMRILPKDKLNLVSNLRTVE